MQLATERLILREFVEDDWRPLHAIESRPDVVRYLPQEPRTEDAAREYVQGIRVCAIFPGATWTPSWEASKFKPERMMPAADIARAIVGVYRLDRRTVVEDIVLRPQAGDV